MKKISIYLKSFSLFIITLITLNACTDDLNYTPEGSNVTTDQYLNNPDSYRQFLAKLYAGLATSGPGDAGSSDIQGLDAGFGQYLRAYFMMQEVPTDEAILGWTGDAGVADMSNGLWASNNQFINAMYLRIVYQVRVCSEYLAQTTDAKLAGRGITDASLLAQIKRYRAEARFLRALSYYHGIDMFGKMTFITEDNAVGVYYPTEKSRADIYNYCVAELNDILPDMADPHTNEYGRADRAAAWMLLAKLYLNAEVYAGENHYSDCLTMCNNILNAGYSLSPNYKYLFMADNNTNGSQVEQIFSIPQDGVHLQSYGGTTFIIHAAIGGSMVGTDFGVDGGWGGLRTRPEFVSKFSNGTSLTDNRAMFYTSGQSLNIAAIGTEFTQGYAITKYTNKTSTGTAGSNQTFTDTDFPMFRLADVYLMYAEAVLRGGTGGNLSTAVGYVKQLRTRAGAPTVVSIDLDLILDERARELYWEGHRRSDLIRFGKFSGGSYNWQWKANVQPGASLSSYRNLFPIPSNQLAANPNLTQNTGY